MAVDMFLQIEGIPGDSTDSKHAKWIETLSYTHSIVQSSVLRRRRQRPGHARRRPR